MLFMANPLTAVVARVPDLPQWYSVTVDARTAGPVRLRDVRVAAHELAGGAALEFVFPAPLDAMLAEAKEAAEQSERAAAAATEAKLRVIDAVLADGESETAAGAVLDLTRQRVQQLLQNRRRREPTPP